MSKIGTASDLLLTKVGLSPIVLHKNLHLYRVSKTSSNHDKKPAMNVKKPFGNEKRKKNRNAEDERRRRRRRLRQNKLLKNVKLQISICKAFSRVSKLAMILKKL